jgi:hypothetical protein
MPCYKMVVLSTPRDGREEEYNHWYQHTHLGELVALPGIRSARRFRMARALGAGDAYPYLAIYEIETDDIDAVVDALVTTAERQGLTMSGAIDTSRTYAVIYEPCGTPVAEISPSQSRR